MNSPIGSSATTHTNATMSNEENTSDAGAGPAQFRPVDVAALDEPDFKQ
jgi:hypothetical protein